MSIPRHHNQIDFSFIQKEFFPFQTPKQVNSGSCFNWCYILYLLYPNKVTLYSDSKCVHAFVKIGDLYFDSESPTGVEHWTKLQTYKRWNRWKPEESVLEVEEFTLNNFIYIWGTYGRHWDMLEDIPYLVEHYLLNKVA